MWLWTHALKNYAHIHGGMMDQVPTLMDEGARNPNSVSGFLGNLKHKIFDLSTMGTLFRIILFKFKGLLDMF